MHRLRRFGNIDVYAGGTGLAAILSLIITRLLWRSLTAEDFGLWSVIEPVIAPVASLLLLGADHAIVKEAKGETEAVRRIVGGLLIGTLPVTSLLLAGAFLVGILLQLPWSNALLLALIGESIMLMVLTALRTADRACTFVGILLARNLVYVAVILLMMQVASTVLPLTTIFMARATCVLGIGLLALIALKPRFRYDASLYASAVRYGFPLLLTTFAFSLGDMSDRWILADMLGVAQVGVYALHIKLAAILGQALVIPFGLWFPVERFKRIDDPQAGQFFIQVATLLAILSVTLAGGVWLARDLLLNMLAPDAPVSGFVLACCLGAVVCLGLSQALNVGLLLPGQTGKNAVIGAIAVVATVLVALVLVAPFGADGAAIARLVGMIVLLTLSAIGSQRVTPMAFSFAALMIYLLLSCVVAYAIDWCLLHGSFLAMIGRETSWTAACGVLGLLFWSTRKKRSLR